MEAVMATAVRGVNSCWAMMPRRFAAGPSQSA